jgi:hypothetical protein
MESILFEFVQYWFSWIFVGYFLIGAILGFMFGSVCGWLHPDNHITIWMFAWPIKLFNMLFSIVSGKIACKKYGHVTENCNMGYSMNSDAVSLYCNRCGKLLKTISVDEADDSDKEGIKAFNEIGNKMFPDGKKIDLRIVK